MKNIVYSYTNDYLIRPTEFMNETFSKMYSEGLEAVKLKRPTKDGRIYKKLSKNILEGRARLRDRMDFYKDRILSKIDYIVRYDDSDLHTSITAPKRNISFEQIVNTSNLLFNVIANNGSKEVAKILQYGTTGIMNLSRAILDALYKEYDIEDGSVKRVSITEDNYKDFIYGRREETVWPEVSETVPAYDGVTFLTEKPIVPPVAE